MSYTYLQPQVFDIQRLTTRQFYVAYIEPITIQDTSKVIIEMPHASGCFVNILCSSDTDIASFQNRIDKVAQFFPLNISIDTQISITEINEDGTLYTGAFTFYIPYSVKATDILLDIQNIGSLEKIKIEIQTNII